MLTTPATLSQDLATIRPTDILVLGPGQYGRIVINRLVRIRGTPGAMVESISVENSSLDDWGGAVNIEDITFGHNRPERVFNFLAVTDNVVGFVASRIRAQTGKYKRAYTVGTSGGTWPGPRDIRINDLRAADFTNAGRFLGDVTGVVETDVALFPMRQLDEGGSYLNTFYTRDQLARNTKMFRCVSIGGATGIRGGQYVDSCYAEGSIVGFAFEPGCHTVRKCVGANCSRCEAGFSSAIPVEVSDSFFFSDLPASQMETGYMTPVPVPGEAHCNIHWNQTGWFARMLRGGCYTRDPAPKQLTKLERSPPDQGGEYGLHLQDTAFYAGSVAQQGVRLEGTATDAAVKRHRHRYVLGPPPGVDPARTMTRWLAEVLRCTPAEYVTRTEPIQAALDWIAAGREVA